MMTRSSSKTIAVTKQLAVLPLLAVAIFFFCIEVSAQTPSKPRVVDPGMLSTEWGAGGDQLKEYEAIVNKYKSPGKEWWKGFDQLTTADRERMETIFFQMSKEEKQKQIVAFRRPIPPAKQAVPQKAQLEKWKDSKMYGVWIDGKRVKNSVLESYSNTDFGHYHESRLSKIAVNYGKHYFQVNLMTNSHYQNYFNKAISDTANVIMYRGFTFNGRIR